MCFAQRWPGNIGVHVIDALLVRLLFPISAVGVALIAMLYLGKEGLTEQAVGKIASSLSVEEFNKLMACKLPEWMRSALAGSAKEYACQSRTSNYPRLVSAKS